MRMGEVAVSSSEGGMEIELELETDKDNMQETHKNGSSEVVRWDRFLAGRVLLVEADDSTRQIISALLRKCSYKVTAVPDGLMAWEALKAPSHNIDLVLTEVELPSISGFALLTLVMGHDSCKNIPVIMMSSHDSISMVLKCMLKGAADFLIKPVRRNELRNLWQHVWRRHNMLGGHVPQNLPDVQHGTEATSHNYASSNHSSGYAASTLKNKQGSEKGSHAQGISQLKSRASSNLSNTDMEKHDECVKLDKELVIPENKSGDKLNISRSEIVPCSDAYTATASRLEEDCACIKTMPQGEGVEPEDDRGNANISSGFHGCNDEFIEPSSGSGAIDLIGTFDNHPKCTDGQSTFNDSMNKFEFAPQLELSLRRFFPSSSNDQGTDERHALNHSTASAFSLYSSRIFPTPASNFAEVKDGALESREIYSNQFAEKATGISQSCVATASNSQENMTTPVIDQSGQAESTFPRLELGFIPVQGVGFDGIHGGYSQVFPPIFYTQSGLPPTWSTEFACKREQSPFPMCTSVHSNPDIQGSEQGYHPSDETSNNSVDQTVCEQKDVEGLRHDSPAAGHTACSSLQNGIGNNNNSSPYRGVCSRIDGNTTPIEAVKKGTVPKSLNEGTLFVHDGFRGKDSHRSSQREAALMKFRLKRKDRCYEKKVRYQSRKSLAEQRPRVKGQFVRQVRNEPTAANAEGCS